MAFSFGLGSNTLLNNYQRDATQFKLVDIATNIQKYNSAPAPPVGQAPLSSAAYVDYTFHHLNRFMEQDQENDNHATFLFEYQALLRSRIQQMITELTSALTRDLDRSLNQSRAVWDTSDFDATTPGPTQRKSAQGYSFDVEDAGSARVAYNFLTGFANGANPDDASLTGSAYRGVPTYDSRLGPTGGDVLKVSPDTSADALFGADNADTAAVESVGMLRAIGTAALQQGFPEDGVTEAIIDNLMVTHQRSSVLYGETGGGFVDHKNIYKFTDVAGNRYDTQNIRFLNQSMADGAQETGNLNNSFWDQGSSTWNPALGQGYLSQVYAAMGSPANPTPAQLAILSRATPDYFRFNETNFAKNEFERVLYDTIFELDQRGLLRDIFRLSEKNGFFSDVQIASTSSLNTGSQIQASLKLNFIPRSTGPVTASTATTITVNGGATNFAVNDNVFVTAFGPPEQQQLVRITAIAGNVITFTPAVPTPPGTNPFVIPGSRMITNREDLGGRIQIIMDRFSAFYHS